MYQTFQIAPRYLTALMLLIIAAVHFMVATYYQIPGSFFDLKFSEHMPALQVGYFSIAVLSTLVYPLIVRKLSLKFTLLIALLSEMLGLCFIWLSMALSDGLPFAILGTAFMGMAFLTVCICITTYLVLEFPRKLGAALMGLFAYGDIGEIGGNVLFKFFDGTKYGSNFFILSTILLSSLISFIAFKFSDPVFPKHLEHLRKGSLIWKEFHYRLGFFILAAIGYGIIESVFAVWGEVYLLKFLSLDNTIKTISVFWFMMMVGKFLLLVPLYFIPGSRIFPLLIISTVLTLIYIEHQTGLSGFLIGFAIAGLSLAAVMPLIITSMEGEIIATSNLSHHRNYLPYIEIGTALIIGAHFLGVGFMAYFIELGSTISTKHFFHLAIFIIALVGLITTFLNWSSSIEEKAH